MDLQSIITFLQDLFKDLSTENEKEEKALIASENSGYRIMCYNCGMHVHKKYNCPNKNDGKADWIAPKWRFQGICRYCNEQDHHWEREHGTRKEEQGIGKVEIASRN